MADATNSKFLITITAVDKATAVMNKINARISAATKPMKDLYASMARFASAAHLPKIWEGFHKVAAGAQKAFRAISSFITPLAAITSAASAAGMAKLIDSWGNFGLKLGQAAARAKITADSLHSLQNAASLAGGSTDAMGESMKTLADNLTDAAGGRAPEFAAMMQQLGIGLKDANGHVRTAAEVLPLIAEKMKSIQDPTLQVRAGTILMGSAFEGILPAVKDGASGLAKYTEEARRHGVLSDRGAELAKAYAHAQESVKQSVIGAGNAIAERLAPYLVPLLLRLSGWMDAHRDQVAKFFEGFGIWLSNIDWDDVIDKVGTFLDKVNGVAQSLGGWTPVLEGIVGFFAARWAFGVVAPVVSLTFWLGRALFQFTAMTATAIPALLTKLGLLRAAMPAVAAAEAAVAAGAAGAGAGAGAGFLARLLGFGARLSPWAAIGSLLIPTNNTPDTEHEMASLRAAQAAEEEKRRNAPGAAPAGAPTGVVGGPTGIPGAPNPTNDELNAAMASVLAGTNKGVPPGTAANNNVPQFPAPGGTGTGSAADAEKLAASKIGQGPGQVQPFLTQNKAGLNAASTAWCAAFVNANLRAVGVKGSGSQVATSFLNWGQSAQGGVQVGDVLVQARGRRAGETGGHVGMASGNTRVGPNGQQQIEMISGNYGNRVSRSWENASSLNVRRQAPPMNVGNGGGQTAVAARQAPSPGAVEININHSNVPQGVTMAAYSSGDGVSRPKVMRTMAGAA